MYFQPWSNFHRRAAAAVLIYNKLGILYEKWATPLGPGDYEKSVKEGRSPPSPTSGCAVCIWRPAACPRP